MAIPGNSRKGNFSKAIIKKAISGKAISGKAILGNYMQCNSKYKYFRQSKAKEFQIWQLQAIPAKAISGCPRKFQAKRFDIRKFQTIQGKKF